MRLLLTIIAVVAVACSQTTPAPTFTPPPTPVWSEAEAIAVFKKWCQKGIYDNFPNITNCQRELVWWSDKKWSASYQPNDKRWAVTVAGETLFGSPTDPIISYVYANQLPKEAPLSLLLIHPDWYT